MSTIELAYLHVYVAIRYKHFLHCIRFPWFMEVIGSDFRSGMIRIHFQVVKTNLYKRPSSNCNVWLGRLVET